MLTTNVNSWFGTRRIVAAIAALVLAVAMALATSGNSWTANAASEEPVPVVADDGDVLAGPSWTSFNAGTPPPSSFGSYWG